MSTTQKVTDRIGDLALEIMTVMAGIGNSVMGHNNVSASEASA